MYIYTRIYIHVCACVCVCKEILDVSTHSVRLFIILKYMQLIF